MQEAYQKFKQAALRMLASDVRSSPGAVAGRTSVIVVLKPVAEDGKPPAERAAQALADIKELAADAGVEYSSIRYCPAVSDAAVVMELPVHQNGADKTE